MAPCLLLTPRELTSNVSSIFRCNLLVRSGEVGGPRKRNVSGSRHLATITDTTDPATDATVGPALHALPPPAPSTMHKTQARAPPCAPLATSLCSKITLHTIIY